MDSLKESKFYKAPCTSQRHAIIRLLKNRIKTNNLFLVEDLFYHLMSIKKFYQNFSGKVEKSPSIFNRSWSDCICQQQALKQKLKTHI